MDLERVVGWKESYSIVDLDIVKDLWWHLVQDASRFSRLGYYEHISFEQVETSDILRTLNGSGVLDCAIGTVADSRRSFPPHEPLLGLLWLSLDRYSISNGDRVAKVCLGSVVLHSVVGVLGWLLNFRQPVAEEIY